MPNETPEEKFALERARRAISERYPSCDDNPDLDPARQDQIDKNRILGEFGETQLSAKARDAKLGASTSNINTNSTDGFQKSLGERPYSTLALAAFVGFVLGAVWKS